MATTVTYVGNQYSVPAYNDTGYAQGSGNLSSYLVALATGSLTLSGGSFPLTADANFGSSFGLVAKYLKSVSSNIAQSGVIRLANTDVIAWRNAANAADLQLAVSGTNILTFAANAIAQAAGTGITLNTTTGAVSLTAPVTIALGGTNSIAALANGKIMASAAGAVVESAIATSNVFLADGTVAMTGAINANSHKITGLTNGSSASDAAAFGQIPSYTAPTAFTPAVTGFGTVSNNNGFYQRVGQLLYVWGSFTGGTSGAVTASIPIPTGAIDNTKLTASANLLGIFTNISTGTNFASNITGAIFADGSSTTAVFINVNANTTGAGFVKQNGSTLFNSSAVNSYQFTVPIS